MKKYPLMEIKDFLNLAMRFNKKEEMCDVKITNYAQFQVVKYLFDHEGEDVVQKDFEMALHVRKSTVSGILDTMEKNNIIVRLTSTTDGRGKIVKLSPTFEKQKQRMICEMRLLEERIVEGISQEDFDVFYGVIEKMKENIKKEGLFDDKNV